MNLRVTSFCIVDLETTGFTPGFDRIVELCVYRMDATDGSARRVFDSVINPHRAITAQDIHGISQQEARKAPSFEHVAGRLLEALSGSIIVAHNAAFKVAFLSAEFANLDIAFQPPFLCTQALAFMLGICPHGCSLEQLCRALHIPLGDDVHIARGEAQATTMVFMKLRNQLLVHNIVSEEDLRRYGQDYSPRSLNSLSRPMVSSYDVPPLSGATRPLAPRVLTVNQRHLLELETVNSNKLPHVAEAIAIRQEGYAQALFEAVSEFQISQQQFHYLVGLRNASGMSLAQVRAAHARVFTAILCHFLPDLALDEEERQRLKLLNECLAQLGWAVGQ